MIGRQTVAAVIYYDRPKRGRLPVEGKRGIMRQVAVIVAALTATAAAAGSADAAAKKKELPAPPVVRSAAGTVIQPTKTIYHDGYGHTTVIVVPRSYLDTGTEVSVGDRKFSDYAYSPLGDPGRPNWFNGPPIFYTGGYPLPRPLYIPGFNPNLP